MSNTVLFVIVALIIIGSIKAFKDEYHEQKNISKCSSRVQEVYRAAKKGKKNAMNTLANCYLHGSNGIEFNVEKAKYWLKQAADRGDAQARYTLNEIKERECNYSHRKKFEDFDWDDYIDKY